MTTSILMIDGAWCSGTSKQTIAILNPATSEEIGRLACADEVDLDRAAEAADRAFRSWSQTPAFDRYKLMRKAAELLRQRSDTIARH
jgi:succinate-semialdehyde dehydrogenase / glutarate-semialdehyde dehydrogenase